MKLYTEEDLIDLVQSLKDYTNESHTIIGHDEREAKEFVNIFLKDRTPIELPSDEEIENSANTQSHYEGAMWLKYKILNQNKYL